MCVSHKCVIIGLSLAALSGCRTITVDSGTLLRPVRQDSARFAALIGNVPISRSVHERRLRMRDGVELHSVSFLSPSATQTIVYFGGNMFTIAGMGSRAVKYMLPLGANLVLTDYRGYGLSGGRPSTIAAFEVDALDAFDQIIADTMIARTQIIVHGHSLGSLAAGHVAAQRRRSGVVLESSVTTGDEWLRYADRRPWVVRLVTRMRIDDDLRSAGNLQRINAIEEPLLFLVGSEDVITPPAMTKGLDAAAASSRYRKLEILNGADHNTVAAHREFARIYREFLDAVRDRSTPR